MFGYITPLHCELKVKHQQLYKAFYCGLCRSIGKHYGQVARSVLQYDCTFLAIVCQSISDAPIVTPHRCGFKPLSKKRPMIEDSAALHFAAAVNVLLAWHKCRDNVRDDKSAAAFAAQKALSVAKKKAAKEFPMVDILTQDAMDRLWVLEQEKCTSIDQVSHVFASFMRDLLMLCPDADADTRAALGELGYNLGRWIYLMDAWDDKAKDKKKGAYNVFLLAGTSREDASFALHTSLYNACAAADRLPMTHCRELIENVLQLGCANKSEVLLHGKEQHGSVSDS